jgi:hypothetical protein
MWCENINLIACGYENFVSSLSHLSKYAVGGALLTE